MAEAVRLTEQLHETPWLLTMVGLLRAAASIVVLAALAISLATLAVLTAIFLVLAVM